MSAKEGWWQGSGGTAAAGGACRSGLVQGRAGGQVWWCAGVKGVGSLRKEIADREAKEVCSSRGEEGKEIEIKGKKKKW